MENRLGAGQRSRVLVTGGSGFIGRRLVMALLAGGADVTVADRHEPSAPGVRFVDGDLRDPAVAAQAVSPGTEVIVHLAAVTSVLRSVEDPAGTYEANVATTAGLLELGRTRDVGTFVLASTNAVVGDVGAAVITEQQPLRPLTPYGATKAAADTAQLALGILRECPEPAVEADALFELAAVRLAAGDPYAAHTCYERALDACRRIGDSSGEAAAQDGMGRALHAIGHRGRAAVLHRRAAALNRELGDTWSLATALDHLAAVHYESGDLRAAQEHWLEAAELFARFDDQVALERHIRIRAALNDPFVKFRARTPDG